MSLPLSTRILLRHRPLWFPSRHWRNFPPDLRARLRKLDEARPAYNDFWCEVHGGGLRRVVGQQLGHGGFGLGFIFRASQFSDMPRLRITRSNSRAPQTCLARVSVSLASNPTRPLLDLLPLADLLQHSSRRPPGYSLGPSHLCGSRNLVEWTPRGIRPATASGLRLGSVSVLSGDPAWV